MVVPLQEDQPHHLVLPLPASRLAVLNCRGPLQRTALQLHISSAEACGASVAKLLQLRADPALKATGSGIPCGGFLK